MEKITMKTTKLLLGILSITAVLAVQVHAQSFLTNGLVAYYPLNGNANDASGNGNNGYAQNTYSTTNQFGQFDSALGFTGNSWVPGVALTGEVAVGDHGYDDWPLHLLRWP
jgi:hypothetical protein